MSSLIGWAWLGLNICAAVAVTFVNKAVFVVAHFQYPVALTFIHTAVTYIAMLAWNAGVALEPHDPKAQQSKVPPPPLWLLLLMACLHAGYLVLTTLSLALNTVSFYQASHGTCARYTGCDKDELIL